MAGNEAAKKFFEALNESSDAMIDAIRAANDRGHLFAAAVIEDTQEGQREAVELARKWASAPFDVGGFYSSLLDNATKAQGRMLDVTRQWFGELAEVQKESRDILQRVFKANRTASEATTEFARGIFTRATDSIQAVTNGDGRKATREPARATEAAPARATEAAEEI